MDILTALSKGYKDIVITICRYAHAYFTRRCFEQLFALMTWDSLYNCYVQAKEMGWSLYQHRDLKNTNEWWFNTFHGDRIHKCLTVYRYPSGECFTKVTSNTHMYTPAVTLPKQYYTNNYKL